jgi:hypothetical protein
MLQEMAQRVLFLIREKDAGTFREKWFMGVIVAGFTMHGIV